LAIANRNDLMRVAFLSSEVVPFAKTGGLADVAAALPKALREQGVDTVVVLPLFAHVDRSLLKGPPEEIPVEWRGKVKPTPVWRSDASGVPAFLIEAPEYFSRASIYGESDDHERFAFFSRAALTSFRHFKWQPDIIHGNDWPCGFAVTELRARRRFDPFFQKTRTLFTIHNLAYLGKFDPADLWWLGFGDPPERNDFMLDGSASALKAGLIAADGLSTVSRRYAQEIQTPEYGQGLDWLLRARNDRLTGITNGVDYNVWNPVTDPHIAANFSARDLSGKLECKRDLLRRFGLSNDTARPIIAIISRLVAQKGYDLILEVAGEILDSGSFLIVLGAGAREYEVALQRLHETVPLQVGFYKGYAGEPLAHQIEAGADMFLMPSAYEPCGLNQMYSMRYASVPIVRATGGLDDTVENYDSALGTGNGFKFHPYEAGALLDKIREALYFYTKPADWQQIQRNGMVADNSWSAAAVKYTELYQEVVKL
jgi:starch synthase